MSAEWKRQKCFIILLGNGCQMLLCYLLRNGYHGLFGVNSWLVNVSVDTHRNTAILSRHLLSMASNPVSSLR